MVNLEDFDNPYYQMMEERSINDKPSHVLGTKSGIYEQDEDLEDETLRLIMNP